MTRRSAALVVVALAVLVAGILFARERALFLQAWVVCAVAVLTLSLLARWSRMLPLTGRLDELVPRTRARDAGINQLEALRRQLLQARTSGVDLHRFFRPNVIEIADVQLARRHGVDLREEPERARELLGADTWELVRPGRVASVTIAGRGWPVRRLETLVRELEEI